MVRTLVDLSLGKFHIFVLQSLPIAADICIVHSFITYQKSDVTDISLQQIGPPFQIAHDKGSIALLVFRCQKQIGDMIRIQFFHVFHIFHIGELRYPDDTIHFSGNEFGNILFLIGTVSRNTDNEKEAIAFHFPPYILCDFSIETVSHIRYEQSDHFRLRCP